MKRATLLALMIVALVSPSLGSSISLFSDPSGTSCNLSIPSGSTGTFYIVAVDAESAPLCCGPGFTGAGFSISGLPAEWFTDLTPSPLAVATVGNPFGGGVQIAFPSSQSGFLIPLFVATVTPIGTVTSATLTVHAPSFPVPFTSDVYCPFILGTGACPCDPDAACVDGGVLHINEPGDCTVGVERSTWSHVKHLYD